jgi:predicted ribosomally synthesized peptide with nif11-like leader
MSVEAVSEFFEKLADQSFDDECQEAVKTATLDAIVDVAARHGLTFTADELSDQLRDRAGEPDVEIGDQDLDAVAGGIIGDAGIRDPRMARTTPFTVTLYAISSTTCPPSGPTGGRLTRS